MPIDVDVKPVSANASQDPWQGGRKGALFGVVFGMNLWLVVLATAALASGVPLWPGILTVAVVNLAMTLVVLVTIELAVRHLGRQAMLPILFGLLLFAVGTMFVLWSFVLAPQLSSDPDFVDLLQRTQSVQDIPVWLGPSCIAASLVPLWIGWRRACSP